MKKLKIGIIGIGRLGYEHACNIANRVPGSELVAISDKNIARAKEVAEELGVSAVYENPADLCNDPNVEAVAIVTNTDSHVDMIELAMNAGKHVFCEKPLAETVEKCKKAEKIVEAHPELIFMLGFMRRYDRGYRQVKELIDSGKFGAPMVIKCTHRADGVADDYTTAMAVTDTAIHEIDVLPWLVNDEWDEVQCIMPKTNSKVKNALKDPQIMIMKTKGGIINMLEVNVNCGFGYDINCEVVCENGVVNLPCPSFPTVRYANEVSTKIEDNWILRFIDSYDVEIQDWVDHALKGETGGSSAWDGYVASITADALVKSQTSGVPEKVVTGGTPNFYKK